MKSKKLIPKTWLFVAAVIILSIPTIFRMLRPGIFSMQDFPYFRLVEYDRCTQYGVFPCRWAMDAGLGYGEPVFNFYSHIPFLLGSIISRVGFSYIDSLKFLFALSIVGSGISMYLLSVKIWKDKVYSILPAMLYIYAPYRAVDVWVRGALPESFAFIFLPLIIYVFEEYLSSLKKIWLFALSFCLSLLILTHNLSVVLFAPGILIWFFVRLVSLKKWRVFIPVFLASTFSLLLSAFYLLPSAVESHLVDLYLTTTGYFDFRAHFVTLKQLFLSRFWGYGGSTWGDGDGLSLSVGQMQWILAILVLTIAIYFFLKKRKERKNELMAITAVTISFFYIFLTHNKSTFIWESLSGFMKYIQFPWRFIGVSVFFLSLSSGYLSTLKITSTKLALLFLVIVTVILNVGFFKEDIWSNVTDKNLFDSWEYQSSASIGDYWPSYGPIPSEYAKPNENVSVISKTPISQSFNVLQEKDGESELPISYFPGWAANTNGNNVLVAPSKRGLINVSLPKGEYQVELKFHNTTIRNIGNFVSFISWAIFMILFVYKFTYVKK